MLTQSRGRHVTLVSVTEIQNDFFTLSVRIRKDNFCSRFVYASFMFASLQAYHLSRRTIKVKIRSFLYYDFPPTLNEDDLAKDYREGLIMNQVRKNGRIAAGTVHKMPADLRKALASNPKVPELWEDITPLARNEWICWVTSGKKSETRNIRIDKALSKLKSGMRRPCCWPGCPHR